MPSNTSRQTQSCTREILVEQRLQPRLRKLSAHVSHQELWFDDRLMILKAAPAELEARIVRKISWRILPFVMLLYFVSFLDRVNVGFVALSMNRVIRLTPAMFGLGGGIFFFGYFLFEVPSNLILYRVGARVWIARVMFTWGIVSGLSAFVTGPYSFYTLRFLLG